MADKVICPECKSTRIWKKGKVPAIGGVKKPRYVCYDCGRTFFAPKAEVKPAKPKVARKSKSSKKKSG